MGFVKFANEKGLFRQQMHRKINNTAAKTQTNLQRLKNDLNADFNINYWARNIAYYNVMK